MDEFEKVYRKNQTKWLRVIQRIVKNPADAEDILQDALCRALSNMDKYNPSRGTYNTWFTQVLFSELKDWMRRNKKNEKNFPIEYYDEAIDYTSFVESRLSLLQRIEATPSPTERRIVELAIVQGYGVEDVSSILKVSLGKVSSTTNKFKQLLKELSDVLPR